MPKTSTTFAFVAAAALGATTLLASPATAAPPSASTTTTAVGDHPLDVAVSQSLGEAFVADEDSVTVVSLLTQRRLATIPTQGTSQNALALVQSNTHAYVTDFGSSSMVDVDTELRKVVGRIPVGDGAVDVTKVNTPSGQRAYVARLHARQLVVVKTSTGKVVSRTRLPQEPQTVTAAPGGEDVWVGSANQGRLWIVDTSSGKIRKTVKLDKVGPVASIAFSPDGKRVAVSGPGGLGVLRASSGTVDELVATPKLFPDNPAPNPGALAYNGDGSRLLVVDSTFPDVPKRGTIAVVETKHYRVKDQVRTGVEPNGLAVDTKRDIVYTANYVDDTVTAYRS